MREDHQVLRRAHSVQVKAALPASLPAARGQATKLRPRASEPEQHVKNLRPALKEKGQALSHMKARAAVAILEPK